MDLIKQKLSVRTGDEAAEVFIIDGRFHRVASSTGKTTAFELPQGLYTVKIRVGSVYQEQNVALLQDDTVSFEQVAFESAAPLNHTSKTHEWHLANAVAHSQKIHVSLGSGSQIYTFIRSWTGKTFSQTQADMQVNPAKGLTLRDWQNNLLVDIAAVSETAQGFDPWAACCIEVDPGIYKLHLETDNGIFEQSVVASPGWQTQVFCLLKDYAGNETHDWCADLANASVFMSRTGLGFSQNETGLHGPDFRLAELAKNALINDRNRLTGKILDQIFEEKFSNPILGLYAAYLLLDKPEDNRTTLWEVVTNLRTLLQEPHPDVEAIAIKAGLGSSYIFKLPPMLRQSWVYVLEASAKQPGMVPFPSQLTKISGNPLSDSLWMIWMSLPHTVSNDAMLLDQLKRLQHPDISISKKSFDFPTKQQGINDLILDSSFRIPAVPTEEVMLNMMQTLGIPRSKLEVLLKMDDRNNNLTRFPLPQF